MKIIHFADLHLGVELYGHPDPETGMNTRFIDFLAAFDKLVEYAISEKADLVLFCGDAFKNRDPSQTQQREFARRIRKMADHQIPVFLLIGNHDLPAASGRATSTEIYDTLRIPRVTVAAQPDIYRIETASGQVQIAALPWPRKGSLESKAQNEGASLSAEDLKTRIEDIMSAKIQQMAEGLDPALPALMAAHIWVDGAKLGSENKLVLGNEPTILLGNIALEAFDYVALGHLHKRQVLHETPPVVYAGSMERLDFGEEADDKGFYVINVTAENGQNKVDYHFHGLEGRRFLTLAARLSPETLDPTGEILNIISAKKELINGAIVQLKISMPESVAPLIRDSEIKNQLRTAYFFSISRQIEHENRARFGGDDNNDSLSPRQALEYYLSTADVAVARRRELLEHADVLLAELDNQ